jgi:hypothetical protein
MTAKKKKDKYAKETALTHGQKYPEMGEHQFGEVASRLSKPLIVCAYKNGQNGRERIPDATIYDYPNRMRCTH